MMNRREVLQLLGGVVVAARQLPAAEPGKPLFFSPDEFALLDALTELIIPADSHSPGARAAGVAAFIDRKTAEAFNPEDKTSWTKGLARVNDSAKEAYHASFLEAKKDDQVVLLKKMDAQNDPFFGQLKNTTVFAYYSSSIGIHEEIEYKGNVLLQEFAGYAV